MEQEKKTIVIQGKEIDYSNLSDEKITQLYQELTQREAILYQRIIQRLKNLNLLGE